MFKLFGVCDICTYFVRQTTRYTPDEKKNRTLINAARNGHDVCLEKLVKTGANVNYECQSGNTALWHAMHRNKQNCADILIEAGADVNKEYYDGTLLAWSARKGYDRNIRKLLKARVNLNPSERHLSVIEAVRGGHEFCLKLLINGGANVNCTNAFGETALMLAAEKGWTGCLKVLKQAGAEVNAKNEHGEAALEFAVATGSLQNTELLIDWGADVNNVDNFGDPVLMKALKKDTNAVCIQLLIKKGANVNSKNCDSKSAVVYAALNSYEQSMKVLIDEGADVNLAVNQGSEAGLTPLIASARTGSINCVRMLLKAGACVNRTLQNSGSNAIKYHLDHNRQENEDLLKLLLVAGETTTNRRLMKLVFGGPAEEVKDLEQSGFEEDQNISLMCNCRDVIRSHIATTNPHVNMFNAVAQLGLPELMCNYLVYNLSLDEKE